MPNLKNVLVGELLNKIFDFDLNDISNTFKGEYMDIALVYSYLSRQRKVSKEGILFGH